MTQLPLRLLRETGVTTPRNPGQKSGFRTRFRPAGSLPGYLVVRSPGSKRRSCSVHSARYDDPGVVVNGNRDRLPGLPEWSSLLRTPGLGLSTPVRPGSGRGISRTKNGVIDEFVTMVQLPSRLLHVIDLPTPRTPAGITSPCNGFGRMAPFRPTPWSYPGVQE